MKKILLSVMTALLLLTAGCDKPNPNEPSENPGQQNVGNETKNPSDVNNPNDSMKTMKITVYYPDDAGMSLVPVEREIKFSDDEQKYISAVSCLLDAPNEENVIKIFPDGAKIKSIKLDGDTAVVDLDSGITKNFVGGSTGEEFLINSVVETLTEFDEVNQVRFLIDGQAVETLAGHMDLSEPIKR